MSSISSVGGYSSYSPYQTIARGGTYNKAAEGASELAIQEKTNSQVKGLEQGGENLKTAKSALNVEDGAMSGITDYLQSIKELSVKAMNGTMSYDDKKSIQDQIEQYKQGINEISGSTTYNEKKLLDGSGKDLKVASDGNGSEEVVPTFNTKTEELGIDDFDVTKDFDISKIDKALESVSGSRSDVGAKTNGVDYALTYNSHAAMELNGYQMNKEEDNAVNAVQQLKTKQVMDMYQTTLQAQKQKDEEQQSMLLFA